MHRLFRRLISRSQHSVLALFLVLLTLCILLNSCCSSGSARLICSQTTPTLLTISLSLSHALHSTLLSFLNNLRALFFVLPSLLHILPSTLGFLHSLRMLHVGFHAILLMPLRLILSVSHSFQLALLADFLHAHGIIFRNLLGSFRLMLHVLPLISISAAVFHFLSAIQSR